MVGRVVGACALLAAAGAAPAMAGTEQAPLSLSWTVAPDDAVRVVGGGSADAPRAVILRVRPCRRGAKLIELRGPGLRAKVRTTGCTARTRLPRDAVYSGRARADGVARFGPSVRVAPRRVRIVALGDSFLSGEGNPNRAGLYVPQRDGAGDVIGVTAVRRARWSDAACHRSAAAAPVFAARSLADGRTHLTVVHTACTGARVRAGLLAPGGGLRSELLLDGASQARQDVVAQLVRARRSLRGRRADAVLVGIGGNELGFSQIVRTCATLERCQDQLGPSVPSRLAGLDADLLSLGAALAAIAPRRRVIAVPYPDVVSGEAGPCEVPGLGFGADESAWAVNAIAALNGTLRAAARRERWRVAGGVVTAFRARGICAARPWVHSLGDSVVRQGTETGTLHPTVRGQRAIGTGVARALRDVIPDTPPR